MIDFASYRITFVFIVGGLERIFERVFYTEAPEVVCSLRELTCRLLYALEIRVCSCVYIEIGGTNTIG